MDTNAPQRRLNGSHQSYLEGSNFMRSGPKHTRIVLSLSVLALVAGSVQAGQPPVLTPPPKPPEGFTQVVTPNGCICVETNVSLAYTQKMAQIVSQAEQRFYQLFSPA